MRRILQDADCQTLKCSCDANQISMLCLQKILAAQNESASQWHKVGERAAWQLRILKGCPSTAAVFALLLVARGYLLYVAPLWIGQICSARTTVVLTVMRTVNNLPMD